MTLRYVLLICVSISVFTAFALAREVKEAPQSLNPYSKQAQDALRNEVENSYFTERNHIAKAAEVSGDPFDDFSSENVHSPQPKDAVRPTDLKIEKSQIAARKNVTDEKIAQEAGDSSRIIYPQENRDTMKEAVIEQKNADGSNLEQDFNPENWETAQRQAGLLLYP